MFRNLECFNKPLLEKQLWRLLVQPQSLVVVILQEKYCPLWNILEAKARRHHSLLWKSLLEAREILKLRLRWRVGNGEKINIQDDKWIPTPSSFRIQSLVSYLPIDATINNLMDEMGQNTKLIQDILWEEDNKVILGIPLGCSRREDKLLWSLTDHGRFIVKSAYYTVLGVKRDYIGSASNRTSYYWIDLWKFSILENVKNFLWRCNTLSLPTKFNLFTRKIFVNPACPLCVREEEDEIHLI